MDNISILVTYIEWEYIKYDSMGFEGMKEHIYSDGGRCGVNPG